MAESSTSTFVDHTLRVAGSSRKLADLEHRGPLGRCTPDERAQASEQLVERKGLREVVVGARVETRDPVFDGIARGEHQHGRPDFARAQLAADGEAVEARQHHVEDDHVERRCLRHPDSVLPTRGDVDRVSFLAQAAGQQFGELAFILDNEHTHSGIVARCVRRA